MMKEQETRFSTKSCCQKSGFCFDTQLQHHSFSCLFVATRNGVPQSECCAGPPHDENLEPLLQAVADPARTRRPRDTPAACRGNSARSLSVCLSPSLFLSLPHPLPLSLPLSSLSSPSFWLTHTRARAAREAVAVVLPRPHGAEPLPNCQSFLGCRDESAPSGTDAGTAAGRRPQRSKQPWPRTGTCCLPPGLEYAPKNHSFRRLLLCVCHAHTHAYARARSRARGRCRRAAYARP